MINRFRLHQCVLPSQLLRLSLQLLAGAVGGHIPELVLGPVFDQQ